MKNILLLFIASIILFSCKNEQTQKVEITYPFNNCIFPREYPAPSIRWNPDSITNKWLVEIEVEGKILISGNSDTCKWTPSNEKWEALKSTSIEKPITCNVYGIDNKGEKFGKNSIQFTISKDSVGAPIFFRSVIIPFSAANQHKDSLRWRLGSVERNDEPRLLLTNIPVCANCHSFPSDGSKLAMDVDNANNKGSYTIADRNSNCEISLDNIMTWDVYKKEDGEKTFGLLAQISPDGKNVLSMVKDRSIFVPIDNNFEYSQLFFPIKGILVNYNIETKQFKAIHGADFKEYVQANPSWSKDGKDIVFARAKRYENSALDTLKSMVIDPKYAREFLDGKKDFKFDLYHIPFNNGNGGKAEAIKGASNNGKSNYFAKYSPDGKWIVYCQANNFMLLQKDSKLFIMPAKGGKSRQMTCNTNNMNSWHSWSPNGKWIVYATKAMGPHTQLFLTHIDEKGNDSPPIWLEYFDTKNFAINIPEFVNIKYEDWQKISDQFSTEGSYLQRAINEAVNVNNSYNTALKYIDVLIETNPASHVGYIQKGDLYLKARDPKAKLMFEKGMQILEKELQKKPNDLKLIQSKAYTLSKLGKQKEAIEICNKLLAKEPTNFNIFKLKLSIYLNQNDIQTVLNEINTYLQKSPKNLELLLLRSKIYEEKGELLKAIADINTMLSVDRNNGEYVLRRAFMYFKLQNYTKSLEDVNRVITQGMFHYSPFYLSAQNKYFLNDLEGAKKDIAKALELASKMTNADPYAKSRMVEMSEFQKSLTTKK